MHARSRSQWIVFGIAVFGTVLYTWALSRVGDANSSYTADVRAKSWKAFFFESIDPGNPGRNTEVSFHGQRRSNQTHASTTDPQARLARKSNAAPRSSRMPATC